VISQERPNSRLRDITRRAMQAEISQTAMTLFVANGFEQTTVDQIAAEVGMSARSVFRYFPSKEDIVVGHLDYIGDEIAATLALRPSGEAPWVALRQAMQPHINHLTDNAATNLAVAAMLADTPALQPALLNKRARWVNALVPNISKRISGPAASRDLRARAISSSALACLNIAVDEWARNRGKRPLTKLVDTAFAAVRD
jgi:AcrR family transcriptional regulator